MMSAPFFWDTSKKQGAQSNFEPRFRRVDPPDLNTKPKKEHQYNNWKLVTPFHPIVSSTENKFVNMDPVDTIPIARSGIKSERGWNCPHCHKYFKKEGLCSKKHLVKEHGDFTTLPDPKMRNYITSKVIKEQLKKTPPKSTYTPNNTTYSDDSLSLDISPVKGEKSEAIGFPKLPGIYEGPMSAIPTYIQPEINDYSDDSSHTSYSVKISNTCVMTDSSRYLGNSLSNRNHESSQEMHDKDDVIYDEGTWVVKVEPKAPEEEDDDDDAFEESFGMDDSNILVDKVDDPVQTSSNETQSAMDAGWSCPQCFKYFKKVGLCAEKHLSKDHGWSKDQIMTLMEECKLVTWSKYKCSTCGKMCRNASNLRKHEKIHNPLKPFGCEFCGATFRVEKYLIQHLHSTHSGSKTDSELTSCPLCEEAFIVPLDLHKHLLVHEDEKNCLCSLCGKAFVHESYLAHHQKLHDNGRKERDCDVCGRKFTKHSHLMNHMLTHTKEKNHACRVCGKVFARRDHLKLHMFKHTGHRPFACKLCDQRFRESSSLRRHIRIHLGIKPYECPMCLNRFQRMEKLKRHVEKLHPNHGLDLSDHAQFKSTNPDEEERLNKIMINAANAAKNEAFPVPFFEKQDMAGGIAPEQEDGSESEAGEIGLAELEYSIEMNDSYDSASEHEMDWNESDLEESEIDSHFARGKSQGQASPLPNFGETMLSSTSYADEYTNDGTKAIVTMETSNNHSPVTIDTNGQSPSSSQNSFQSNSSFEDNQQSLIRHKTKGKKRADISSIAQKLLTKRMDNKLNVNIKQHTDSEVKEEPKTEILNGISEDDTHSKRNDGLSQDSKPMASPCESEKNNNDASNSQAENDTTAAIKSESESGLTVKSES